MRQKSFVLCSLTMHELHIIAILLPVSGITTFCIFVRFCAGLIPKIAKKNIQQRTLQVSKPFSSINWVPNPCSGTRSVEVLNRGERVKWCSQQREDIEIIII